MSADQRALRRGTTIGHYEVLSALGSGGMGEVYLAQDRKLSRKVALKFLSAPFTADQDRLRRFEQEARAASSLNHPNILTVYEVGEFDGHHFIASEFIDGDTLRTKVREGGLEIEAALEAAIQIASALKEAHAAGIIHRDIKPENVMVRRDGYVKVLDFGLAKLTERQEGGPDDSTRPALETSAGVVMGTVSYMSPEQARGLSVDARTDIWSLGVVLYELLAGTPPFHGPTASDNLAAILERDPRPLSTAARQAPAELQRIVVKALRKDRDERYQTVADLLLDLKSLKQAIEFEATLARTGSAGTEVDPPRTESGVRQAVALVRRHPLTALGSLTVVAVSLVGLVWYTHHRTPITARDTVLLADFVNTTGDATFDGTLKQALAVQLSQTPFLNLLPAEGVRETLRYMGRSEDERITLPIAREICQRRGLKAALIGTIASLGRTYVITLEAINGQTSEVIATQQIEADGKEHLLRALGQAALDLRRQLGESLSTLQKYNAPIEQATTSSLDALNVYSKGLEEIYRGNSREALPLFNRAVEIDPRFAEAYVWLAWTYANFGDPPRTAAFARQAYALRDRVTELEKLRIDDIYHMWASGDFAKQKEADELITRLYPHDWVPHNSLSIGYNRIGQQEKAVAEAREGIRLNPNEVHLYWHLATALIGLNRFDEARKTVEQGRAQKLDHPSYRSHLYAIAFVQGDTRAMQQELTSIRGKDGERAALALQARTAAFGGHWRDAEALYRRVDEIDGQSSVIGTRATPPIAATSIAATFGFCDPAGPGASQALAVSRTNAPSLLFVPVLSDGSLCGDASEGQKLADEQARRYPAAIQVKALSVPMVRGAVELKRNQPGRAIEVLSPAVGYEGGLAGFYAAYLRGQAYLRLRRTTEAASEFRKILDHRGWDPLSHLFSLAHLGLARALAISGDAEGSRRAYRDFVTLWRDADPDLPVLTEAKKELEQLK